MEQQPGQDPDHDGPSGPQPGDGPPGPASPGLPEDAGSPGVSDSDASSVASSCGAGSGTNAVGSGSGSGSGSSGADAHAGTDGDDESEFGPWDALEGTLGAAKEREELLSGFARGGVWDKHPPGPELAAALARAAGPDWRCAAATGEELVGLLRAMAAQQSWAGAGLLGVIRALIRDDDPSFLGRPRHGDLADEWDESLVSRDRAGAGGLGPVGGQDDPGGVGARGPPARRRAAAAGRDPGRAAGAAGRGGLRGAVGRELRQGRGAAAAGADGPAAQDVHPDRADRHRDRRRSRPGPGRAAAGGGGEAPVAGDDVPRAVRRRPACRVGTCRPTRPWPRSRTWPPAPGSTRTPARSRASGSTGSARRPTSTSSTASRPTIASPTGGSAPTTPTMTLTTMPTPTR